ncbi:Transmembrane protein 131 [Microtus ochrogaster]|uniref:Transmembrane protein 131 n=1 Tax=Microtus ochrogaster TaxID=79684 RepID=A0A8J6G5E9_MICOH|nr:Transmembrane protein 131 [Microtus ochrogaster]
MGKRAGGGAAATASASSGAGLEPAAGRGGGPRSAATGLLGALHLVMTLVVAAARAEKEAFMQSESIIEVLRFDDGGLLQTETTLGLSSYQQKSISLYRGNCRPIRFEPPMLDFHEQPVGMPKMEKVYLHNPSSEETITLVSISATTSHFHASFFQNRKILPGGNTSFDVVFLARVVGNVENTLFINTSNHGVFTYQVVEMYSSGGDLHLELPTGQQGGTRKLWEIPPYETKGVMRASFSSREADNHTAFIRIKTNASDSTEFIILPVEVEVTTAPGIYSSTEMLDFGTLRTQASRAKKPSQFSGKITVKAKEKSYSKLEIPYQAEVLDGYLGFDHAATLFHIQDSPAGPVERPIYLTNTFSFAILIHDVLLPEEAKSMFQVYNFSKPVLILPNESGYIFTLVFMPSTSSMHIDNNILLVTNASKFHLPVRVYTGFLDYFVLPPKIEERFIDFGVLSATEASNILFAIINSNPIELAIKSWHIIGDGLSIELVATEKGNRTTVIASLPEFERSSLPVQSPVTLASGHFAVFRVKLTAKKLEGIHDGAIQITTDYEILTIPVKAVIAVGSLTCFPKHMVLPPSFPGKIVHQSLNIMNSFSQKVKIQHIRSLSEDVRFYYKRLRGNKEDLEPGKKSKIANIYFDPGLQCGDHCYIGLPFLSKSEPKVQPGVAMQEDSWDADWDVHQSLFKAWMGIKENSGHRLNALFEINTDLQKNIVSKITAELSWPSILSSPRHVKFPLTNTNCSSEEEITLENPADVPVYVQFIPVALYSKPSIFVDKLVSRNNLTVMDAVMVQGQGTTENLRVSGKLPGPGSSLRFKITEALLKDCIDSLKLREPNFTLKRTFKVENTGQLEVRVETIEISGYPCEGYGFKVVNCQEFALSANTSRDIIILFTPDFTASRVIRELKFITTSGSEFVFVLNASLPYHMLAACAEALPRPNWELALYIIISGVMSALFLLVIGTAYLEAQGIWEPFRRRLSFEASNPPFDVGRPFDLRRIAGISSEGNLNTLGCEHSHGRSFYSSSSSRTGTGSHRQCGTSVHPHSSHSSKHSADVDSVRTKNSSNMSSRTNAQAAASQATSKTSPLGLEANAVTQGHTANRKSRGTKQSQHSSQHHGHNPLEQHSQPPPPVPQHQEPPPERLSPAPLTHSSHPERASNTRHSSEDSDITSLIEAMDKDFDHHDSPPLDVFTEQPPSPLSKSKGNLIPLQKNKHVQEKARSRAVRIVVSTGKGKSLQQRKAKPPKKQEEKEKRTKGKSQEDELKDTLADDDSSSTTTETSNPDTEPLLREDTEKQKGKQAMAEKHESEMSQVKQKSKKLLNVKKEIPTDVKGSSFELPYTPSLENKQRRNLPTKIPLPTTLTSGTKSRNPQKTKGTSKLVDNRPVALSKFLPSSQELGNTSSSEGEKDSPPPEWDAVPVHKPSSSTDSLYKLSLQTLNADIFLKQRQTSPTPASPSPPTAPCPFTSRGSYSSIVNSSSSDTKAKQPSGSKSKLTKAASLPGKNGNPTFAAVTAGYDKSPGGNGFSKMSSNKSDFSSSLGISHIPVDSDGSDSSGLWSPVSNPSSPDFTPLNSFSAFGNSFNLTGAVFSKLGLPRSCSQSSQRSWNEFNSSPSYLWDSPATDPSPSWPASSSSPTHTATSILGNASGLWSTTPFSSSIWSSNLSSALPFTTPANTLSSIGLMGTENSTTAHAPSASAPADDLGQTYNPWRIWSPTIGRRSSDPWSNSHFPHEN